MITLTESDLAKKKCKPCRGGTRPMTDSEISEYLQHLDSWHYHNGEITKTFDFKDFNETMHFANAIAWIAHQENHHPTMDITFRTCRVGFRTNAIRGISENDFIVAAKVDALIKGHC